MQEIWKPVEGYEGLYEVSNTGKVKALERLVENNGGMQHKHEKILRPSIRKTHHHCIVALCKNGKVTAKFVHRLVAIAFIPNPDNKPVVDHIDTDPMNNRVDNLRWVTTQENCLNPLTRQHNSASKMGHPFRGRALTQEERNKLSKALSGRTLSDEHKQKLSYSHKNSEKARAASRKTLELIKRRKRIK